MLGKVVLWGPSRSFQSFLSFLVITNDSAGRVSSSLLLLIVPNLPCKLSRSKVVSDFLML